MFLFPFSFLESWCTMKLLSCLERKVRQKGIEIWIVRKDYDNPDDNDLYVYLTREEARKQYNLLLPGDQSILDSEKHRCEHNGIDEDDPNDGIHDSAYYQKENCYYHYCDDGYGYTELYFILSIQKVVVGPCNLVE